MIDHIKGQTNHFEMEIQNKFLSIRNLQTTESSYENSIIYLVQQRQHYEALELFSKHPINPTPELLLAVGVANFGLKRYSYALEYISQAVSCGWDTAEFHYLKGQVLFAMQEYETALEAFVMADKMHPTESTKEAVFRTNVRISREQKPETVCQFTEAKDGVVSSP